MNSANFRREEDLDEDGYRFVRFYDGEMLMEKQSYRPDGTLTSKVVYEWDLTVSQRSPVRWKAFDQNGNLENSVEHVGFDEAGSPEEGVMYDPEGREIHRVQLRARPRG